MVKQRTHLERDAEKSASREKADLESPKSRLMSQSAREGLPRSYLWSRRRWSTAASRPLAPWDKRFLVGLKE